MPVYEEGAGATLVYTLKDRHHDPRTMIWLVEKIAAFYSLHLPGLRRRCGALLGLKHHISLPMNENLVLLPVKVRQAAAAGETTIGYVNMLQVEEVAAPPGGEECPWLSTICFKGGLELKALNTAGTLETRLRQGRALLDDLLKKRWQGPGFTGLSRKSLQTQLPNCDCLLRELFMEIFGLEPDEKN